MVRLLRAHQVAPALEEARRTVAATPNDVEANELLIDILAGVGLGYTAEQAYKARAQEYPKDPLAWYLYGRAAVHVEDSQAAYEKALSLNPRNARAVMGMAALERATGDLERAERDYKRALQMDSTLDEAWSGLGAIYVSAGRWEEAVSSCREAIEAVPGDPEAYLALAELRPDEAAKVLARGVKEVPGEPRLHAALAQEQIRARQYKDATASLERALMLDPTSSEVALDLALVRDLDAGRITLEGQAELVRARALVEESPVAARLALEDLIVAYPNCHLVWLARGHLRSQEGDLTGAEADLRKALKLAPNSPDCQAALGLLLLNKKQYREAVQLLDAARAQRPHDASLAISAGMARAGADGPKAGLLSLDETAARFPFDSRPVMAMVSLLTQMGNTEGAYTVLQRAVSRYPDPTLLLALAAAAKDLGHTDEAIEILRNLERATGEARYGRIADQMVAAPKPN